MAERESPTSGLAEPAGAPPRGRLPGRIARAALGWAPFVAALAQPLATVLARRDWRADILAPFTVPALVLTLLALAFYGVRRRPGRAALLLGLACVQAFPVARYWGPNPVAADPSRPQRLRILIANVLVTNEDATALADLIRRERPDVVGLVEVDRRWIARLDRTGVRGEFPVRHEWPTGTDGLALWFRRIEPEAASLWSEPGANPAYWADIRWAGAVRRLWLVHPLSPFHSRGRAFDELARLGRGIGGPSRGSRLVVGDLNRNEGSPHFGRFLEATGLRDSRLGFGLQPTWPTASPYRIAIDHAFASPDLAVVERRRGPDIGSDHLPLIVEVAPAASTNSSTQAAQSAP